MADDWSRQRAMLPYMSELSEDNLAQANFREILARIDRQREEALKFAAEQRKLIAEEQKLRAEAEKLSRDRGLAPWTLVFVMLGALGGVSAGLATLVRLTGGP